MKVIDQKIFIYKSVQVTLERCEDFGNTVILYKQLTLEGQVGEQLLINPFVVTEVFSKVQNQWQLVTETYTRIANDPATYAFH